jgi:hypothetical protein
MPGAATRLAIEWRHAWPVRFAHHPLCARHRHETWRIGRLHLCRGCAALGVGLALGSVAVLGIGGPWTMAVAGVLAPLVLIGSWPPWYRHWPRLLRDLLRVALGLLLATGTYVLASAPFIAWPILPVAAALWWAYRRRRAQVNARRCDGCPELGRGVCSGYTPHAQAMRAIAADLEARLVDAAPPLVLVPAIDAGNTLRENRRMRSS